MPINQGTVDCMLMIRHEQMEAFNYNAREQVGRKVILDLKETAPHTVMGLSSAEMDARLATALEMAEKYTLREAPDLRSFIRLCFVVGPLFAEYPAAHDLLISAGPDKSRRMTPLFEGMKTDIWERAADNDIVTRAQTPFPFDNPFAGRLSRSAGVCAPVHPSISIEPLATVHAERYFHYALHPDVWRLGRMLPRISLEQIRTHIRSVSAGNGQEAYAIRHSEAGFIGAITLRNELPFTSIAYWVARPFWGYGVATNAIGKLLVHLSKQPHSIRLRANIARTNLPSIRLVETLGWKELARTRESKGNRIYEFHI